MRLEEVTPLILTFNEGPNLRACLTHVRWARRVIVLDSASDDDTEAIARSFPQVDFRVRPFDSHTAQWNFGLSLVDTQWVLTLDADLWLPSRIGGGD